MYLLYLQGKKMLLKIGIAFYLFLFGYACFMCSLYFLGLLSGLFWQGLAFLVNLIACRRLVMAAETC